MKLVIYCIVFLICANCATFSGKTFKVTDHDGDITIRTLDSYNQAAIQGTEANVLTQSGRLQGAGRLLSGEIAGGSGAIEIIIENTGNLGFEGYK